jgi:hypothetical protein
MRGTRFDATDESPHRDIVMLFAPPSRSKECITNIQSESHTLA